MSKRRHDVARNRLCLSLIALIALLCSSMQSAQSSVPRAGQAVRAVRADSRAVWSWGDSAGFHIGTYMAGRTRQLAVLHPNNIDAASWSGQVCTTGDGRYVAVVVAPTDDANSPADRAHGGFGYSVDLETGRVRPLEDGVAITYFNPGCGLGTSVAITTTTVDDSRTRVRTFDAADGRVKGTFRVAAQLTSAVPDDRGGAYAVEQGAIVHLARSGNRVLAGSVGTAFDLAPTASGLDYLTLSGRRATLWAQNGRSRIRLGHGVAGRSDLFNGVNGVPVATGMTVAARARVAVAGYSSAEQDEAVSPDGEVTLTPASFQGSGGSSATVHTALGSVTTSFGAAGPVSTTRTAGLPPVATSLKSLAADAPAAPACAVPRNDPTRQALQPNAKQVDWAIEMATQNRLMGANARPSNFEDSGLPSYAANSDFPAISLVDPSGGDSHTVPPIVFDAIAAQESNFSQASWHALPGIAGNPLIADYYGTGGNSVDLIDYSKADCGYGVVQVTDGMHAGDSDYSADEQARIAIDYEEDIAAGLNILERTWNQLAGLGIIANNGNPTDLENWYFAAWAYNTGIHGESSHGTAGLGWANNPANPDYKPNRAPYLQKSYDDAKHPSWWPYQERIFGWMSSPLIQYGSRDYAHASYRQGNTWMQPAPFGVACAHTNYCTPPGASGTPGCSLADYECWWTGRATWVTDCASACAVAPTSLTAPGAPEPAVSEPNPPTCKLTGDVPATKSGIPIVVDDLAPGPPLNAVGCSTTPNWSNGGSFTYAPGTNASGQPIGLVDTHQLGAGFGGRVLFTHVEPRQDTALVNMGVWAPVLPRKQYYDLRIHVPATGADDTDAVYTLTPAPDAVPITIHVDQAVGETWINAGAFGMAPGASLELTNAGTAAPDTTDIAFDAVAFVPQGGNPTIEMQGTCPRTDILAARGSGQKGPGTPRWSSSPDDPQGMGSQLATVADRVARALPGTTTKESLGYLADSVVTGTGHLTFIRDLEQGVSLALDDLRRHYAQCKSRERYVLLGYSQGAMVLHRVVLMLQRSTSPADHALLNQIRAVFLLADGDRMRGDTTHSSGTAPHGSRGIAWRSPSKSKVIPAKFAGSVGNRVLSVCDKLDIVCDFPFGLSTIEIVARVALGLHIHTHHYMTDDERRYYVNWIVKNIE